MPWMVTISTRAGEIAYAHVVEIMLGHHTRVTAPEAVVFHVEASTAAVDHDIRAGDRIVLTWQPDEQEATDGDERHSQQWIRRRRRDD
jgi:hypothetical protein